MNLSSEDYAATVELLTMRLWAFVPRKSMVLPLEIHVTGTDDDVVIHATMTPLVAILLSADLAINGP